MTETIRLRYATSPGLGAALIRWFSDSEWSHVDAVLPDGGLLGAWPDPVRCDDGRLIPAGVQVRPHGYAPVKRTLAVRIETPRAAAFYRALRAELGKPYDWRAIRSFVVNQHRDWRNDRSWFCSELVIAKGEEARVFPHRFLIPAVSVTPAASLIAFNALPGFSAPPE